MLQRIMFTLKFQRLHSKLCYQLHLKNLKYIFNLYIFMITLFLNPFLFPNFVMF